MKAASYNSAEQSPGSTQSGLLASTTKIPFYCLSFPREEKPDLSPASADQTPEGQQRCTLLPNLSLRRATTAPALPGSSKDTSVFGAWSPPALLTWSKKPTSTADMGAQTPSGPLLSVRRPPGPCCLAEAAVMFRSPQGFNADKGCSSNKAALLLPISVWKQKLFTCEEHVDPESHHEALWRVRVAYKGQQ